ncbi:MAG TPA: glycerophosphodiester phosphodiesterase [Acidimicrobiales bacterium]|nr:glycerophosphodiester phosphodiesterase [Acidimicrobiales bacterium]
MSEWLARRVIAYAHQGGSFEGPSSTLAAIERALDAGASGIELDVHATQDRRLVVCHDDTVDRTTNRRGAIAEMTLEELRQVDNAYWWIEGDVVTPGRPDQDYQFRGRAPADRRFGVATLEEVARTFPDVLLNLDIKGTAPEVQPYEEQLADEITRLDLTGRVIVASFHDSAIQSFRRWAPSVPTSAATDETADFYFSLDGERLAPSVVALQVPARYGTLDVVTESFVAGAHAAGIAVHVWTINDVDEMRRLVDLGVDGLISDRPSVLTSVLRERGCLWEGLVA